MSVILKPSRDLDFLYPISPNHSVGCVLSISNANQFPIDYKVMTTAPKWFLARPSKGRIEAGKSVDVVLHYQLPRTEEEKERHRRNQNRFLVESKIAPSIERSSGILQRLWSHARTQDSKEPEVHRQKLRVRTLPPMNEIEQSSPIDHDGLPTYEDVLSSWQSGNPQNGELLSHVEGAQRELDHLQITMNGLREALRQPEGV